MTISDINAENNGGYPKSRNIDKFYYFDDDRTS